MNNSQDCDLGVQIKSSPLYFFISFGLKPGLPKGPNNYHPVKKYNSAIARRNYVLSRLYEEGMISRINYSNSLKSKINVVRNSKNINFRFAV